MDELSKFSRALIEAAQGGKTLKLQKRVAKLLDAGYKPTDADLFALKYYFSYDARGRPPLTNNPARKIAREVRDYCRHTKVSQDKAFEHLKIFAELRGYKPEEFKSFREKTLTELRRSKK
jgi:hypothetical protein